MSELKLGRLPQRRVGNRFAIAWAHQYMAAAIPAPVYPIDVSGGITAWGMLGNDQYGDCGEAGQLHYQMASSAATGTFPAGAAFTDQIAIAEYLAFTNGQDTGVVLADFLLWLYRKGEILGFAPVDLSNRAQADSLMAIFHGLYVGVSLTPDAQQLFGAGRPWTVVNGERPDPQLGHCILKVRTDGAAMESYVTWGIEQAATRDWSAACVDEAWVVVTTQDQADQLNMPALFADIDALGGIGSAQPGTPNPTPPQGCLPMLGLLPASLLARLFT